MNEVNRAFVFEIGSIRPLIDFPQSEQAGRKFNFQKNGTKNSICLNIQSPKTLPFPLFADGLALFVREITSIVLSFFSHPFLRFYQ